MAQCSSLPKVSVDVLLARPRACNSFPFNFSVMTLSITLLVLYLFLLYYYKVYNLLQLSLAHTFCCSHTRYHNTPTHMLGSHIHRPLYNTYSDVNTSILFVSSTSALFLLLFCSVMFFAKMESDFFPFFVKLLLLSLVYGFSIVLEMYTCGREASVGVLVRNPLFVSSRIYS